MSRHAGGPVELTDKIEFHELGRTVARWSLVVAAAGLLLCAGLAFLDGGLRRVLFSYLVAYAFFLSIAVGALFFVLIQHVTRAGWSVVIRRLPEALGANFGLLAVLFLPILLGLPRLYRWAGAVHDHHVERKAAYLNLPFFTVRWVVYFAVWGITGWLLYRRSVLQDSTGETRLTLGLERISAIAMIPAALVTTFAAFDLLMSLDPLWFSTIFGVYFWSGGFLALLALLPLLVIGLQRSGRLNAAVTVEHYHDMGKLIFAFTIFWAYIAFSQYMLIWYGNIPEETTWFLRRQTGGWTVFGVALIVFHFAVPFFGLIARRAKRRLPWLATMAILLLVMHWVDLYWVAIPEFDPQSGRVPLHLADLAAMALVGGLFLWGAARRLAGVPLLPQRDPRLAESLAFENV